ncbi:fish-egg lectin-like [Lepisosteus oculatus]|uniref:fish-egg lectin-like n=1 Tax=Lepisosteus oculatus TaxID=7918 RepID=UPI003713FAA6
MQRGVRWAPADMRVSCALQLLLVGTCLGCLPSDSEVFKCRLMAGLLRQIDAGAGQVYGLEFDNRIVRYTGGCWARVEGLLRHITVGTGGVWGVDTNNSIQTLVNGSWVRTDGNLKQIDLGGEGFIAGVSSCNSAFCLSTDPAAPQRQTVPPPWTKIPVKLDYLSCGPYSCWGVSGDSQVFVLTGVSRSYCSSGENTTQTDIHASQVSGHMARIEVGADGSVFGLSTNGIVYQRHGVTSRNPVGHYWLRLLSSEVSRSLSYDDGVLWLIGQSGRIRRCARARLSV